MDLTVLLAKFWGWYLLIFFLVLSFKPSRIKQIFEDLKDQKFALVASFMATIVGLINILLYNVWEPDWTIIITLIGWFSLAFGVYLFIFQQKAAEWLTRVNVKFVQFLYIVLFLLGVYLLNMGYQLVFY